MKKTKLAKAVSIIATGAVISLSVVSAASARVMYNTGVFSSTDGWTGALDGNIVPWVGTVGGVRPFNYIGYQALNWAVEIDALGSTQEVSQANSISNYGFAADIDTANGAWGAWQVDPANASFTQGWAHSTDFGLFKSLVDTTVEVKVSKVNQADNINNFGITVFTGMDDNTGDGFGHHSPWNIGYISGVYESPAQVDNPFGTGGLTYLTHGDESTVSFQAEAGQVYSIYLGGNDVGGANVAGGFAYKAEISTVPVPAAAWLFGSALLGLLGVNRKRTLSI